MLMMAGEITEEVSPPFFLLEDCIAVASWMLIIAGDFASISSALCVCRSEDYADRLMGYSIDRSNCDKLRKRGN